MLDSFQVSHVGVFVLGFYIIDQSSVLKLLNTTEMFWLSDHTHTHTDKLKTTDVPQETQILPSVTFAPK